MLILVQVLVNFGVFDIFISFDIFIVYKVFISS